MKICIVEDEKLLAQSIAELLSARDYECSIAPDGKAALAMITDEAFDLIILDVMLPFVNGFDVASELRRRGNRVPILMLTAKSDLLDRIDGLNAGADYYLTKPFDTRELLACIGALLRRTGKNEDCLTVGNTSLDINACELSAQGGSIRLSAKEFELIRIFFAEPGRSFAKEFLLTSVWGYDSNAVENNVEVYIGFLRKKLAGIGSNVKIEAIRRVGYHLEVI